MSQNPLISVALCTYNGQEFLREQLDSLLNQTYTNTEIIIVDDCSQDKTLTILQEYELLDSRINVFTNSQNLGYTKNFEKALMLCQGEFIAISDQDDIWHLDKLRLQLHGMNEHQILYHDSALIDQHGNSMHFNISDKFQFYQGSSPLPFLFLNCVSGHTILMRKSLLKIALPFNKNFHYDQWIAFVATSIGSISYIPQPLVFYRQHQDNSTDLLSTRTKKKKVDRKEKFDKEQQWLQQCTSIISNTKDAQIVKKIYQASLGKDKSLFSLRYFSLLWSNRDVLFSLMKKNTVSKFFFILKNSWGTVVK